MHLAGAQLLPPASPSPEIPPPASTFNETTLIQAISSVPTTHVVRNDQDLWVALQQADIQDLGIVLTDDIELKDPIWDTMDTIVIPPGRVVEIRSNLSKYPDISSGIDAIPNAGGKTLNFMNRTEVISISQNGTLTWVGVHITGTPSVAKYLSEPFKKSRPQPYGLATFPSVLCDPGCQIAHNYTVVDYFDLNDDCSDESLRSVAFRAGIALNNASAAGIVSGAQAVYLRGQGAFTFPVLDPSQGNATVGNANVLVNSTVRNCLAEAAPAAAGAADGGGGNDGGGGGLPAWAWALIGLAIAFALISSIVAGFVILRRRKQKKNLLPLRNSTSNSTNRSSTGVVFGGNSPPSSLGAGFVDADDNSSLLPSESMSANEMDVAAAAAMDLDVSALIQMRNAWRSRIGRVHGLEFQEAVGRGGFGTVYKSFWRGVQVAVKLVEHSVDSRITKQIQREAALATSCSHPNIVVTYKVATAGLGDLQKLPHYVEVSAAAAASASAAGDVELVQFRGGSGGGSGGANTSKSASVLSVSPSTSAMKEDNSSSTETIATATPPPQTPPPPAAAAAAAASLVPGDLVATLIIMEFCDLGSMKDALYIQQAYTLNNHQRDAVALLRTLIDVALGLDYLHSAAGVVHGDIKPGNVLLKSAGNTKRGWIAKLGDFGVAREALSQTTLTSVGRPSGTLAYMSLEMIETGILTAASDTYAFGILMWEGWTGLHPFGMSKNSNSTRGGAAAQMFLRGAGSGQRPPLNIPEASGIPETYVDLMVRCWQQDMEARPAMAAVVLELREILKQHLTGTESGGGVVESNNTHFLRLLRGS